MKTLIFSDNSKAKVIEENGKHYITKNAQFRKSNPDIVKVIEEPDKPKAEEAKPKKSPASKKKEAETEEKGA